MSGKLVAQVLKQDVDVFSKLDPKIRQWVNIIAGKDDETVLNETQGLSGKELKEALNDFYLALNGHEETRIESEEQRSRIPVVGHRFTRRKSENQDPEPEGNLFSKFWGKSRMGKGLAFGALALVTILIIFFAKNFIVGRFFPEPVSVEENLPFAESPNIFPENQTLPSGNETGQETSPDLGQELLPFSESTNSEAVQPSTSSEESAGELGSITERLNREPWFSVEQAEPSEKEPIFRKPANLIDLITNTDWKLVLWYLLLGVIVLRMRMEREAEQQPHDWRLWRLGTGIFVFSKLFDQELAIGATRHLEWILARPVDVSPGIIPIVGGITAVGLFFAAAKSQTYDLTPLSTGLFTIGGILVATDPSKGQTYIVGFIAMGIGLLVHLIEVNNQHGGISAIPLALTAFLLFLALRSGFNLLLGLVALVPAPDPQQFYFSVMQWLLNSVYNNKVILAAVISALITYNVAQSVADLIFTPILKAVEVSEGQLSGTVRPTEDTPRFDAGILVLMTFAVMWLATGHP